MRPADVKALRWKLGVTQKELAAILKCNPQTVGAWEQGNRKPGEEFTEQLNKLKRKAAKMPEEKLDTPEAEE